MKTISLLCPSRGRAFRARTMVASAVGLAAHPERLEVLVRIDHDDPKRDEYIPAGDMKLWAGPRVSVPAALNELARHASGDLLMTCPDDLIFRTEGWDDLVRAAFAHFPDGLAIAYTNDGRDRGKCEMWFTGREWVKLFGHFAPDFFEHFCADQWVEEVASGAGRLVYLREVVTEHMHHKYGKAPNDDTYRAKRGVDASGKSMSDRDNAVYLEKAPLRARYIEALSATIEELAHAA